MTEVQEPTTKKRAKKQNQLFDFLLTGLSATKAGSAPTRSARRVSAPSSTAARVSPTTRRATSTRGSSCSDTPACSSANTAQQATRTRTGSKRATVPQQRDNDAQHVLLRSRRVGQHQTQSAGSTSSSASKQKTHKLRVGSTSRTLLRGKKIRSLTFFHPLFFKPAIQVQNFQLLCASMHPKACAPLKSRLPVNKKTQS
jgi:hypothetical protein